VVFEDDGYLTYGYKQSNPIPAYLIAIVCGSIVKAQVGPRSSVWAEKPLIDACVHEFSQDTEKYIQAGEKVTGVSYDWGTYDMVVLPGAFPYGGMENPNLTFLSSSLLAGDRSLTNVVAHEITHSWSGNYVTNSSWSDFWLNEGFTVYIERMIMGEVNGEQYRYFEILCGYNDLIKTTKDLMADHSEYTKLLPNLTGVDPDDAFSKIPYEKGSLFLLYLEKIVGGDKAMRSWLKTYFSDFRTRSVNTEEMKQHFLAFFSKSVDGNKLKTIDWEHWLKGTGMPNFDPNKVVDRSMVLVCETLSKKWIEEEGKTCTSADISSFLSKQTMYFLDLLITSEKKLSDAGLGRLDELYKLSHSKNVEINFRYLMLSLKTGFRGALPVAASFLSRHGRGLYAKPLYRKLKEVDHGFAKEVYNNNKTFYHSVIQNYCRSLDLHL